jgi:hypothetical protein
MTSGVSLGSRLPSGKASRRADVDFSLLTHSLAITSKTDAEGHDAVQNKRNSTGAAQVENDDLAPAA